MKHSTIIPLTIITIGLGVLGLHANSAAEPTEKDKIQMRYRYIAAELAEETIEAYQALEANDVELTKKILLNAIVNYIEDERGGSGMADAKTVKKEERVREEFRKIYSDLMGFNE
jgi:hypothetical protein